MEEIPLNPNYTFENFVVGPSNRLAQAAAKAVVLSCETFTNHFIAAVERGTLEDFRHRYRHVDFLLIDDIHQLADKERTQEEFFHTFNTLYNAGKQIILTSDSPPKEIPTLGERLVSRFKWGLVACMEPPHFETRVAIMKKKAAMHGYEFPPEVVQHLAEKIQTNVREMEGAIVKIIAYSSLTGERITLNLAREATRDVSRPQTQWLRFHPVLSCESIR
jgi:chromosomal replication initiator protein